MRSRRRLFILVVMGLVAVGVGRFINPLLLTYLLALSYMVLEVLEGASCYRRRRRSFERRK